MSRSHRASSHQQSLQKPERTWCSCVLRIPLLLLALLLPLGSLLLSRRAGVCGAWLRRLGIPHEFEWEACEGPLPRLTALLPLLLRLLALRPREAAIASAHAEASAQSCTCNQIDQ